MTRPDQSAFPLDPGAGTGAGLTKREYFAACALSGLLTSPTGEPAAPAAVALADALILALNVLPIEGVAHDEPLE